MSRLLSSIEVLVAEVLYLTLSTSYRSSSLPTVGNKDVKGIKERFDTRAGGFVWSVLEKRNVIMIIIDDTIKTQQQPGPNDTFTNFIQSLLFLRERSQ